MEKKYYSGLDKKELRTFCVSFSIGMLLIAIFSILRQILKADVTEINFIPAIITGSIFLYHQIVAWTLPENPTFKRMHFSIVAMLFFYVTSTIFKILTRIIGVVVFGVIFYLLFTPASLIFKINKKDHIKDKITGWQKVPEKINLPEQCRKLF